MTHDTPQKALLPIDKHLLDPDLAVWRHHGTSGKLVISFTGIGAHSSPVPPFEFAKIATEGGKHDALFISDPNRTWLNGAGLLERIAGVINDFVAARGADRIAMIGHSMGGYAALILPGVIGPKVESVVAFAPQFSVHPEVVGDDPRWKAYRRSITTHRIHDVSEYATPGTMYHVFHGDARKEHPQRDRFPVAEDVYHMIVPKCGHQLPRQLRKRHVLEKVAKMALNNRARQVRLILEKLGGHRRTYKDYPALAPSCEVLK